MEVSPGTEQFYRIKLGRFLSDVNADNAARQDIETFLLQFDNPGNRHAYYRTVRTFYNWREETFDLPIVALHTLWRGMHPGDVIFSGRLAPRHAADHQDQ